MQAQMPSAACEEVQRTPGWPLQRKIPEQPCLVHMNLPSGWPAGSQPKRVAPSQECGTSSRVRVTEQLAVSVAWVVAAAGASLLALLLLFVVSLSRRSAEVFAVILEAPPLGTALSKVEEAGCEVLPDWANGAKLLGPLAREHVSVVADTHGRVDV